MIRVRNRHPRQSLQCAGRILAPGVWHEVDERFRQGFGSVPELEFEEYDPEDPSSEPLAQPSGSLEAVGAPDAAEGQSTPPYEQGRAAAAARQPEDSCPFSDRRTRDAKEWRRGWREVAAQREAE